MSKNRICRSPQYYAARIQSISADALEVEQRILADGLTVRDIAIVAELMQRKLDVYDEMLTHPPTIQHVGENDA